MTASDTEFTRRVSRVQCCTFHEYWMNNTAIPLHHSNTLSTIYIFQHVLKFHQRINHVFVKF